METDTAPRAPLEIFSEWQRCLAANDQQGAAKVVDAYTEVCLGPTDRTTGYGVAAANVYRNMVGPWSDMTFSIEDLTESADGVTVRSRVAATQTGEFLGIEAGRAGKPEGRGVATTEPSRWLACRRAVALVAGLAALGLVAGGCGGGAPPPVANLGTGTTPSSSGVGGGQSSSPQGGASPNDTAKFVEFADCMTKHGFPISISRSGNGVGINPSSGAGSGARPDSPQFRAAMQACQKLLPGGGPGGLTPAQQAQARQNELALATCMRQHGYPTFPDPTPQGVLNLDNMGNVPNGPQFRAAMDSCQSKGAGAKGPVQISQRAPGSTPP